MESLTAIGESKSLTDAGDSKKSLIIKDEKSLLTAWGLKISDYFEQEKSLDHCWRLKILGDLWGLTRPLTTSAGNENPS